MSAQTLSEREQKVLRLLIESYVKCARPVSSSAIASDKNFPLSSATVRNVLRSLEEKRLILQPHTSAGRIPTDRGYRYYVDFLMEPSVPSSRERSAIESRLAGLRGLDRETVVTELSRMLSDIAKEFAVSVAPGSVGVVERIDLVPLAPGRAVAAATMRSGATGAVAITLDEGVSEEHLREASSLLNEWLGGARVADAESLLLRRMRRTRPEVRGVLKSLLRARQRFLGSGQEKSVHYEGARYIFKHPELMGDAASLAGILDSDEVLVDAVRGPDSPKSVAVRIGCENARREMRRMSLIVGTYRVGQGLGNMAVIGPTRMKYPRLVGLLSYLSGVLDGMLGARR